MEIIKAVTEIAESLIDNEEIFIVEVNVTGKPGNQKIQVIIDGDGYVDVEECSKFSKKLAQELEERDIIEGRYIIEVSSPGADKPLKLVRQYPKHIGRELEIITKDNIAYRGVLLDVANREIKISVKSDETGKGSNDEPLLLAINNIERAKVVLKF